MPFPLFIAIISLMDKDADPCFPSCLLSFFLRAVYSPVCLLVGIFGVQGVWHLGFFIHLQLTSCQMSLARVFSHSLGCLLTLIVSFSTEKVLNFSQPHVSVLCDSSHFPKLDCFPPRSSVVSESGVFQDWSFIQSAVCWSSWAFCSWDFVCLYVLAFVCVFLYVCMFLLSNVCF